VNEDESYPGSGKDMLPEVVRSLPLDSETESMMLGKSTEHSPPKASTESRMQSRVSEIQNSLIRHAPYGLWTPVMANVDWRNQGPNRESSALLPGKKMLNCGTDASAIYRNSATRRTASSEGSLVSNSKDIIEDRVGREREQFNLWKMASLVRGISPSENDHRKDSDEFCRGSAVEDGKLAERLWTLGRNDHHLKMKSFSASSALSYPIFEAGHREVDTAPESDYDGKKLERKLDDNAAVIRSSRDQPAFVPSSKAVELLTENSNAGVSARMRTNSSQSCGHLSENAVSQRQERSQIAASGAGDTLMGTSLVVVTGAAGSGEGLIARRSLQREDIFSKFVGASQLPALPSESASSRVTGQTAMCEKSPETTSESCNNGNSLYRRRLKNLVLKRGNSLNEGCETELLKSPRIQNSFGSEFEHVGGSLGVEVTDSGCSNFHRETCCEGGETDVVVGHPSGESDYKNEVVHVTACHSDCSLEQVDVSKSDKLVGISSGVVNYATVSSESMGKDL